jgi:hypothetical protein
LGRTPQLFLHVLLVQSFDRMPVQPQLPGHRLQAHLPAAPPHKKGEAFRVERVVGYPVQPFPLHLATTPALDSPNLDFQINPAIATGQVPDGSTDPIIEPALTPPTTPTGRFFCRRSSTITLALGSRHIPFKVAQGRNPGYRYSSSNRRRFGIRASCQVSSQLQSVSPPDLTALSGVLGGTLTHTIPRRAY